MMSLTSDGLSGSHIPNIDTFSSLFIYYTITTFDLDRFIIAIEADGAWHSVVAVSIHMGDSVAWLISRHSGLNKLQYGAIVWQTQHRSCAPGLSLTNHGTVKYPEW